jgi:hypothetical protein
MVERDTLNGVHIVSKCVLCCTSVDLTFIVRFEVLTAVSMKMLPSGMLRLVVQEILTGDSEVLTASIIRAMMEAASTSETCANFYQTTRRYNPEDSHLNTRRRENLKSYL